MQNYDRQLKSIEKRRWQLWGLSSMLIVLFAVTIAGLSYYSTVLPSLVSGLLNMAVIRVALVLLSLFFCIYIFEKELIFWRVSKNLINEKVKIETINHEMKRVETLLDASQAVNSTSGVKSVLDVILKSALGLLKADHGSIMLYSEMTGYLEIVNSIGLDEKITKDAKILPGQSVAGKVYQKGKPEVIVGKDEDRKVINVLKRQPATISSMCAPLKTQEKTLGVVNVSITSKGSAPFIKQDLKTLSIFAEQAATAIENAKLLERAQMSKQRLQKLFDELQDKNKSLKQYVLELKNANDELEKFNHLTVNRELEMVRLKEKIKKLEKVK